MKVVRLKYHPTQYSCQSYLILGEWNRLEDVNTLVDAGVDGFVLEEIAELSTGVGKKAVEQIILTHGHFDHCAGVAAVKERYACKVRGFSSVPVVEQALREGEIVRCGDAYFEIIYTPGHSQDSICLYCKAQEVLFSGDLPLVIKTVGGSYTADFVKSLEKLTTRPISTIYPGHGEPICGNVEEVLNNTLRNVLLSTVNPE